MAASFPIQTYGDEYGYGRDMPLSIHWTPDGKSISYLLNYTDLWVLPVQ
jgi:hypothetical protein